ncbi:MAG: hypothetical protein ACOVLE_08280 [Pirellula staleyi]
MDSLEGLQRIQLADIQLADIVRRKEEFGRMLQVAFRLTQGGFSAG